MATMISICHNLSSFVHSLYLVIDAVVSGISLSTIHSGMLSCYNKVNMATHYIVYNCDYISTTQAM